MTGAAKAISIHAPLAGCDRYINRYARYIDTFQSTHPLRGATRIGIRLHRRICISIHAPLAGCDGILHQPGLDHYDFNPRTPCGVRPDSAGAGAGRGNFNPRTPCGVRHCFPSHCGRHGDFNPRTPCGVRHMLGLDPAKGTIFQSTHPLRGATHRLNHSAASAQISIHAPLAGCDFTKVWLR